MTIEQAITATLFEFAMLALAVGLLQLLISVLRKSKVALITGSLVMLIVDCCRKRKSNSEVQHAPREVWGEGLHEMEGSIER